LPFALCFLFVDLHPFTFQLSPVTRALRLALCFLFVDLHPFTFQLSPVTRALRLASYWFLDFNLCVH
jgi:hypothetical protein